MSLLLTVTLVGCNTAPAEAPAETAAEPAAETKPESTGKRIYFAGPLFNEAERAYNLRVVEILENHGYEVFLPQRDGFLAAELEGKTEEEKVAQIFKKDHDEVLKSDIIFMVLDGRIPDEGACVELGMAYEAGKRCYGFKNDARSVELYMELNPLIAGCFVNYHTHAVPEGHGYGWWLLRSVKVTPFRPEYGYPGFP